MGADLQCGNGLGQAQYLGNMITPAAFSPRMIESLTEKEIKTFGAINPLGRIGDAATDVAPVVVFLVGPVSQYMTANHVRSDGGFSPI